MQFYLLQHFDCVALVDPILFRYGPIPARDFPLSYDDSVMSQLSREWRRSACNKADGKKEVFLGPPYLFL